MTQKYAFLDRDGTLIYEPQSDYQIDSLDKLIILKDVIPNLQKLLNQGYKLIMISNQDGMGTTSFPREDFEIVQKQFEKVLENNGIQFEEIFICPHFPKDNCACRKPKITLVKELEIDKESSFVCGDRESDKQFAKNLGIKFLSVETNKPFKL